MQLPIQAKPVVRNTARLPLLTHSSHIFGQGITAQVAVDVTDPGFDGCDCPRPLPAAGGSVTGCTCSTFGRTSTNLSFGPRDLGRILRRGG
jgi:hypothetical protein